MLQLNLNMNMTQMIQIHDHDTGQDSYLIEQNGEWVKITKDEYNNKIRGQK